MRTTLKKIGNSQGILIPAPLLAECGITNEIELHLEGTKIVIESARLARAGWFDSYRAEEEIDAREGLSPGLDNGDWEW